MTTASDLPVDERIVRLLQHLGIQRAHFAGRTASDWRGLVGAHPEVIASLTLLCPDATPPDALRAVAPRLLTVMGDRGGTSVERVRRAMGDLPEAGVVTLDDYSMAAWSDVVADRTEEVEAALVGLLEQPGHSPQPGVASPGEDHGEVAGISYRIRGSGPPLVLLPLALAPSQWDSLLPKLSERYCTITLGGAELGFVAILEARGRSAGYLRTAGSLLDEVKLQPGESVLDVGCGSGALDRWLVRRTAGANPVTAADVSPYLLREAEALAVGEGLDEKISFGEGNAEELPFADDSFDVAISVTVMEEVNADRMLAEMVRVTRPGGRVAVIVRATDMPWWFNIPLRAEVKAKLDVPGGNVEPEGCADASLYRRFRQVGLVNVKGFPVMAAYDDARGPMARFFRNDIESLSREEAEEAWAAVGQAEAEGTFFFAWPHHCAVGTKPN